MTDRRIRSSGDLDRVAFDAKTGLVPVVTQDRESGDVLMVAWANREALERTLGTGEMHYWSRSRNELWRKGATSGNTQSVVSLHLDCDGDTVLARVRSAGPACHTGEATCFGEGALSRPEEEGELPGELPDESPDPSGILVELDRILARRQEARPEGSYTVRLLDDENLRLKKLGEETAELVTALAKGDPERIPEEAADLLYHLLAALRGAGVPLARVFEALEGRRR